MFKACAVCGKIHPSGKRCFVGKFVEDAESKARRTNAWRMKAEGVKADANYLCEVCREQGVYVYENLEVHHIVKLRDAPDRLLDDTNLICLCNKCHRLAEKGLIPQERLFRLARERIKPSPPPQDNGG